MSKPNVSIGGARISWNSHRTLTIFIFLTKRAGITDIRDSVLTLRPIWPFGISTIIGISRFFLFLSFLEPHHQNHTDSYVAPRGYAERYRDHWVPPDLKALGGASARQLPGYYGLIKKLDEALGRIDDALISLVDVAPRIDFGKPDAV